MRDKSVEYPCMHLYLVEYTFKDGTGYSIVNTNNANKAAKLVLLQCAALDRECNIYSVKSLDLLDIDKCCNPHTIIASGIVVSTCKCNCKDNPEGNSNTPETPDTPEIINKRPASVPEFALWPVYKYVPPTEERKYEIEHNTGRTNTLDAYDNLLSGYINRIPLAAYKLFHTVEKDIINPRILLKVNYNRSNREAVAYENKQFYYDLSMAGHSVQDIWVPFNWDLYEKEFPIKYKRIKAIIYAWEHPELWEPLYKIEAASAQYLEVIEYIIEHPENYSAGFSEYNHSNHNYIKKAIDAWNGISTWAWANLSIEPSRMLKKASRWCYNKVGKYRIKYGGENYIVVTSIHDLMPKDFVNYSSPNTVGGYPRSEEGNINFLEDPNRHTFEKIICVRKELV